MAHFSASRAALLAGAALFTAQVFTVQQTRAQNNPAWFIPGQRPAPPRPAARPGFGGPEAGLAAGEPAPETSAAAPAQQVQVQLPPPPAVPDVSRAAMPPAAVIGVLSIPDVLRTANAYRAADKAMAERREKLNQDAQREQVALRDLGQQFTTDRAKLSPEQIRGKERDLQDRITASRRKFTERNQLIQESGQYGLAQIERTLSDVVQKVAASHGMNLVLQRSDVALNGAEFDITAQVAELLNKTLPSVVIPPEGVAPPLAQNTTAATPAAAEGASAAAPKPAAASPPHHHR